MSIPTLHSARELGIRDPQVWDDKRHYRRVVVVNVTSSAGVAGPLSGSGARLCAPPDIAANWVAANAEPRLPTRQASPGEELFLEVLRRGASVAHAGGHRIDDEGQDDQDINRSHVCMESTLPPKAWGLRFEPATGRRMLCAMSTLLLLGMTVGFVVSSSVASEAAACDPVGDAQFVCGQSGPEDLVAVPGAPWVLASGYAEDSGGICLIDTRDLTTTVLAPTASPRERHDRVAYGSCPGPIVSVEKENFSTHGLYLDAGTGNVHTVYATHHGTRESVEVFELDLGGQTPVLTWIGCAVAPDTVNLNSVVSLPGDGFAATSFRDRGTPIEPLMTGAISGAIWEWHTDTGWAIVPGSETSEPNGIEISPHGRWFYLAAWGTQAVARISRGRTPVERDELPTEFRVDNLRLAPDGSILATGQGSKGSSRRSSATRTTRRSVRGQVPWK